MMNCGPRTDNSHPNFDPYPEDVFDGCHASCAWETKIDEAHMCPNVGLIGL